MKLLLLLVTFVLTSNAQPQYYPFLAQVPEKVTSGTASPVGINGSATYYYWIVAKYPVGNSFPGGPFPVYNAPNVLSVSNYVKFTYQMTQGATGFDILRTTSAFIPASGNCICLMVSGDTTGVLNDTGALSPTSYSIATANYSSGNILLNNRDYATARYIFTPSIVQSLTFGQICFIDLSCQTSASMGGTVASVFGRTGAVVAATNDYNFNQLAGTATIAQGGSGQTIYTKGDLLIGNAIGGLTKFAVCPDTNIPIADSTQALGWRCGTAGAGTVVSVGMTVPNILNISGSPITSTGTFIVTLASQADNLFFGAPDGGGTPVFRTIPYTKITGTPSGLPPNGSASGDLCNTYPNPVVCKINGNTLGSTTPSTGALLVGNGTQWGSFVASGDATITAAGVINFTSVISSGSCGDATHSCGLTLDAKGRVIGYTNNLISGIGGGGPPTGPAGGDLSSTYPDPTVAKINGNGLGDTTPNSGATLIGNGTLWISRLISGDATLSSTGVVGVTKINGVPFTTSVFALNSLLVGTGSGFTSTAVNRVSGPITVGSDISSNKILFYNRVFDVGVYGALNDCTGNSTAAFQAAASEAENYDPTVSATGSGGGRVVVRPGCYNIAGTITLGNGSASGPNTKKPVSFECMADGTGGDVTLETKTCEIRWTGGNQGATTYIIKYMGPYPGGGMNGFTFNMQNATNVLAIYLQQAMAQKWEDILIWQGASGPQITCTTVYNGIQGCGQLSVFRGIQILSPGTNGEGILLTGGSTEDTHGSVWIGGTIYGTNYAVRLGYADNNYFARTEFHSANNTSTACGVKFDRDISSDARFPHENLFVAVSSTTGICGKTGNGSGTPNTFWTLNTGDCTGSNCDPANITDGNEPMALSTVSRNAFGLGNVTLLGSGAGLPFIMGKAPNSVGGTELYRLSRGGVSGNGLTINTLDDVKFTQPNAIYHATSSATNSSFIGTVYSSSAAADRYAIRLQRARGTESGPATAVSADRSGIITFEWYTGAVFGIGSVISSVAPVISGTNISAEIKLSTTEVGTLHDTLVVNPYGGIDLRYPRILTDLNTLAGGGFVNNGSIWYCSDCVHASSPCSSGGTGGRATRLNGVWQCN